MNDISSPEHTVVQGQLALRTIHGRNGPFRVGMLSCHLGQFVVKDRDFEQFRQGRYSGEFTISRIYVEIFKTWGGFRTELRAKLAGMALATSEQLDELAARRLPIQEVDPIDEEQPTPAAPPNEINVLDPLVDIRPFGMDSGAEPGKEADSGEDADAALFGELWPLPESFKLDVTLNRRILRLQVARLDQLNYAFDELAQLWYRVPDKQAA